MAKKTASKVKGCRKCGREARKLFRAAQNGNATSLFVRGRISAKEYFALTKQSYKG